MVQEAADSILVTLPDGVQVKIYDLIFHHCRKRGEIDPSHWAPPALPWWQCARCLWEMLEASNTVLKKEVGFDHVGFMIAQEGRWSSDPFGMSYCSAHSNSFALQEEPCWQCYEEFGGP